MRVAALFYPLGMDTIENAHDVTLWMVDDVPARMVYAGRRWRVTDTPTPLCASAPGDAPANASGWRFQATDPRQETYVFDVYRSVDGWHVHRAYE